MTDAQPAGGSPRAPSDPPAAPSATRDDASCASVLAALLAHPVIRGCGWSGRLFFRDTAQRTPRVDPCEAVVFLAAVLAHQAPDAPVPEEVQHARHQLDPERLRFLVVNARRHELPLFRATPAR